MAKNNLVLFKGTKINKKIVEEWSKTIMHDSRHPVRDRLEEALIDNLQKHGGEMKDVG